MKTSTFHPSMISAALQSAEAMRDTPLAARLKANGFTPARMEKDAAELSALQTQALAARNAAVQATAELGARAREAALTFSAYSNLVRALTNDEGLRRKHGVKTPGHRKGPLFHRSRKTADASLGSPAATAEPALSAPVPGHG